MLRNSVASFRQMPTLPLDSVSLQLYLEGRLSALHCDEIAASRPLMSTERINLIGQLLRDVEVLRRVLKKTISHINALAPIINLPPELLAMIFSFAVDVDPHRQHALGSSSGWVRVTHVCQAWRELALRTPSLWSRELGRQPRASFPAFLERAGRHAPLRFSFPVGLPKDENAVNALFERSSRVEALDWTADKYKKLSVTRTIANHSFHALKRLHLDYNDQRETRVTNELHPELHLPSLRTLHLADVFPPIVAPHLTSLTMTGLSFEADAMYRILRGCSLLEFISIRARRVDFDRPESVVTSIQLSHLIHLEFIVPVDSSLLVHHFLERLDIPHTACLTISRLPLTERSDLALIEKAFSMAAKVEEELALAFVTETMTLFTIRRVDDLQLPKVAVSYRGVRDVIHREMLPTGIADHYLARVVHLSLWPSPHYTAKNWETIFLHTPEVKTLTFTSHLPYQREASLKPVFDALGRRPDEQIQPASTPPLPHLVSITLQRDVKLDKISLQEVLVSCLEARADAGAPQLQRLFLENFDEDSDVVVTSLRSLVHSVVWKGP